MKPSIYETIANLILIVGAIAAVLAFASHDAGADADQLAFFVGALLQSLIVLVPALFMWGVLRGVADIKRVLSRRQADEEHDRLAHLLEDESVRKVIVERPGGEVVVLERAPEELAS